MNVFGYILFAMFVISLVYGGIKLVQWLTYRAYEKEKEKENQWESIEPLKSPFCAYPPEFDDHRGKPKWIAFDKEFRLGYVDFHLELKKKYFEKKPNGGGWFNIDRDRKIIYLYKLSTDFGQCTEEQVMQAIHDSFLPGLKGYQVAFSTLMDENQAIKEAKLLGRIEDDGRGFAPFE